MMKVPQSVRRLYEAQREINELLEAEVDEIFKSNKRPGWFYESRIKGLESFALKLETGRFEPDKLEDFFACRLVVENTNSIKEAIELVQKYCNVHKKKPPRDDHTHKAPEVFEFDDIRLYATLEAGEGLPRKPIHDVRFEIQVKTFLQHAWSIATHDLIYKSDEANWAKSRIAFQIKAMLEHAEVSIQMAEQLSMAADLAKADKRTKRLTKMIKMLKDEWGPQDLPSDVKRLAENIDNLLNALEIDRGRLKKILREETAKGGGTKTLNLSPFGIVVQSICLHEYDRMKELLQGEEERFRVFLPDEILDLTELPELPLKNAVLTKTK